VPIWSCGAADHAIVPAGLLSLRTRLFSPLISEALSGSAHFHIDWRVAQCNGHVSAMPPVR
jgi:hypothetical protein